QHLHHRLLELGHSHRRAVLLLYFWSALVGFIGAATAIFSDAWLMVVLIVAGAVVGVLLLVVPRLRTRSRTAPARNAEAPPPAAAQPPPPTLPSVPATPSANGASRRPEGDLSRPSAL
ncbi:MAG: undecaprenyl/decaprenyl-phosphate alpha-N-acetylglucosaminyl 1-phosphate transferase, partial [Jatrophihabitantaceae bacterium]